MRLSTLLLLPVGLIFASPAALPEAAPQPAAAPLPTLAARLAESAELANVQAEHAKRQLTVSLFGATAIVSNGVICGGIGPLTGCLGSPGTNSINGTIRQTGGTLTGSSFTFLYGIPTPSTTATTATATDNGAIASEGPRKIALAAGMGALAFGLL